MTTRSPTRRRRRPARWIVAGVLTSALAAVACSPMTVGRTVVDMTMSSACRAPPQLPGLEALPATSPPDLARYQILAGDLHCHVSPPDSPEEATRGIAETVALARSERLDFVVLTPHVGALFFTDDSERRWVLSAREEMRAALAREDTSRTVFILGMEYTDHRYGHVGASFADLEQVLADVPISVALDHPERFFEAFVHEALNAGRVCVRAPEACSFEARSPNAAWTTVGGAVRGEAIEVRAAGDDIEVFVDGVSVQRPASGVVARLALDATKCSVVRARVGEGYSAPIYANCAFAAPGAR